MLTVGKDTGQLLDRIAMLSTRCEAGCSSIGLSQEIEEFR